MGQMLFRTNIVAYVGKGNKIDLPTDKVVLHDCIKGSAFGELKYISEVLNVRLRKDILAVCTVKNIFIYNF